MVAAPSHRGTPTRPALAAVIGAAFGVASLALATAHPAHAGSVTVAVRLEPARIGLGETATLSIETRGGLVALGFRPSFELDNLAPVGGPSTFESMEVVNGLLSRSLRMTWRLRPLAVGPARVRDGRIEMRGRVVALPVQQIQVQAEPTASAEDGGWPVDEDDPGLRAYGVPRWPRALPSEPAPDRTAADAAPLLLLRAEPSNDQPFVGEQVLLTINLYRRTDVSRADPVDLPSFPGFWVRDLPMPQRLPTEIVTLAGVRYGRVALQRKILFPLRPGSFRLDPVRYEVAISDFERSFFAPPIARPRIVVLSTLPATFDVRPLPETPSGEGGTVGELAVTAELRPRHLDVGSAATLRLRLTGTGHLDGLATPRLALPAGLRALPPHEATRDRIDDNRLYAERTFDYVLVPDRAGEYRIEPPAIPVFDAAAGRWRTVAAPAIELVARQPPVAATPQSAARGAGPSHPAATPPAETASPRSSSDGRLAGFARGALDRRVLPWLIAAPSLLGAALVLARRRRSAAATSADPEARRLAERLHGARTEPRPRRAATAIESAWGDYLAARWPDAAGQPPSRWPRSLAERGLDPDAVGAMARVADDLDYLRSAPQLSSAETLRDELIDGSLQLLARLGQPV